MQNFQKIGAASVSQNFIINCTKAHIDIQINRNQVN